MFRTTNALGDHMVLQRDTEVRIWGKGDRKDDIVTVKFGAYEADGFVNKHLEWLVILPPMAVNTVPQEMTITCNDEKIVYTDILVGDVWVVNGQSNAEATVTYASDAGGGIYEKEMDDIPENIRIVNQRRVFAIDNPEAMKKPQFDMLNIEETSWRRLETRKNLESMSAIGYFFARKIAKTLNSSIPLGIINVSSGGSPMMELIMPEFIEPMNYTAPEKKEIPLAGIYNAMLAPIQKMAIKGMLFYQGESEQWRHKKYPYQLKWYVDELRRRFDIDFPFYYVQISSHQGPAIEGWKYIEEVRYEQTRMLEILDNAYMAVSMDVGGQPTDKDWAHPPYKLPIGERLAEMALAEEYFIGDIEYAMSPIPYESEFEEDKITVYFEGVGDGLKILKGDELIGFEARTEEGEYTPVKAIIVDGDAVEFSGVQNAVALRYAHTHFADWDHANLGSSTDKPCAAFEIFKDDDTFMH